MRNAEPANATAAEIAEAEAKALLCERFEELAAQGYSLNQAASALGKSPSWFSGFSTVFRWRCRSSALLST